MHISNACTHIFSAYTHTVLVYTHVCTALTHILISYTQLWFLSRIFFLLSHIILMHTLILHHYVCRSWVNVAAQKENTVQKATLNQVKYSIFGNDDNPSLASLCRRERTPLDPIIDGFKNFTFLEKPKFEDVLDTVGGDTFFSTTENNLMSFNLENFFNMQESSTIVRANEGIGFIFLASVMNRALNMAVNFLVTGDPMNFYTSRWWALVELSTANFLLGNTSGIPRRYKGEDGTYSLKEMLNDRQLAWKRHETIFFTLNFIG